MVDRSDLRIEDRLLSRAAAVPRLYRLTIPLKPPSKNDVKPDMGITRMGHLQVPTAWLRVKRLEEAWAREIPPASVNRATGKRRVQFTRVMGPRERAYDEWNLAGGLNSVVVDILRHRGWLLDDRIDLADMQRPIQRKAEPGEAFPATIIELQDIDP